MNSISHTLRRMRALRHKPKYNDLRLVYQDVSGIEHTLYCNDVTSSKYVSNLIGQPIKDSGSRFITDSDIDFEIDGTIIMGDNIKRITELPEVRMRGNNMRRGYFKRSDKVIVTT